MYAATIVCSCLLWVWFLGCVTTWKFGKILLVEGMGVKSAEFIVLVLFSAGILSYILFPSVGQWILFFVLLLWLIIQFFCHWYYTIFGATEKKLKGYNECFAKTVKLFPASNTRLIPDLYHILLHLLIAVDLALVILGMV